MDYHSLSYWFLTGTLVIIAFFLIRFYYLVDEIRKDVKSILIRESKRDEAINNLKEDVEEIKVRQQRQEDKLNNLQLQISKMK